ncbi:MAG: hypothetical protein IPO56_12735 [Flavobacteriales bacterium]|nr:hypothetical protein [Flavobacteriales bacterium]
MNSRDPNYQMMNSEQKAQFRQDAQAPAAYGMALGLAAGMDLAFTKGAASRFVVGMMAAQTVEHNTATSPQGQAMQEQRTSANVSNLLLLYGTGKLATALAPAAQTTSTTAPLLQVAATQETTLLYRGVNNSHVAFAEAELGIVRANGGTATPLQHNTVPGATLWSPFTSWTTNPAVAENFALRPNGSGVVIQAEVPLSQTVMSPNLKSVLLKQSGNIVSESEVLVGGTVKGTPTKVP